MEWSVSNGTEENYSGDDDDEDSGGGGDSGDDNVRLVLILVLVLDCDGGLNVGINNNGNGGDVVVECPCFFLKALRRVSAKYFSSGGIKPGRSFGAHVGLYQQTNLLALGPLSV